MARAVCIRCGTVKKEPSAVCAVCNLDPHTSDGDLVKSVYLSTDRFDESEDQERYGLELEQLAASLRSGTPIVYVQSELDRLDEQRRLFTVHSKERCVGYGLEILPARNHIHCCALAFGMAGRVL